VLHLSTLHVAVTGGEEMSPTASSDPNAGSAWAEAITAWCHPSPSLLNSRELSHTLQQAFIRCGVPFSQSQTPSCSAQCWH